MAVKADEYIRIDRSLQLGDEPETGHNRWHPDIKPLRRSTRARSLAWKRGMPLTGNTILQPQRKR